MKTFVKMMLVVITITGSAFAQQGQGRVPFGTYVGSQYDTVNLANLSIQVNATLRAKPGLMSLSYEFGVDDFVGFPGRHFVQWAGSDVHNGYVGNAWHGSLPNFPSREWR